MSQNTLGVHGLPKRRNSGMTEYINLEPSENDKGDDQKGKICMLPLLLNYRYC